MRLPEESRDFWENGYSQMKKDGVGEKAFQGDSSMKETILCVSTWKAHRYRMARLLGRGEPGLSGVRRCGGHFVERLRG